MDNTDNGSAIVHLKSWREIVENIEAENAARRAGEYSERARYVTEQVALWIANDSDYIVQARYKLRVYGVTEGFMNYLKNVLRGAPEHSAPWQVAQELSPNDYNRVHWDDVAREISPED